MNEHVRVPAAARRSSVRARSSDTPSRRPALVVGRADDPLESHADAEADRVLSELRRPGSPPGADGVTRIRRNELPVPARERGATRIRRAFQPATVTKPAGASLHKSDRKAKAVSGAPVTVRSGGIFGTGLKIKVPNAATLQVDFTKVSQDGHYLLAQFAGVTGYVNSANVVAAPVPVTATNPTTPSKDKAPLVSSTSSSSETEVSTEDEAPDIDDIFHAASTLSAGLSKTLTQIAPLTFDLLAPYLAAAPQDQRDAVWKDKALMARVKVTLSLDDYLALIPALGMFKPPKAGALPLQAGGFTQHFTSREVDELIAKHLSRYVSGAVSAGRKAEGEISVVGNKDWELAFKRQWGTKYKPDMADAFVDVDQPKRHIWIHKERGDPGTALHEGMHKYANDEIRNRQRALYRTGMVQIGMLDEGLTEYFTRKVASAISLKRLNYYADELRIAVRLMKYVGEPTAAKAYFDGEFDGFIEAYLRATKRSQRHWAHLSEAYEQERYAEANTILDTGAEM